MPVLGKRPDEMTDDDLLKRFKDATDIEDRNDIKELDREEIQRLKQTGVDLDAANRLGTFIQTNCNVASCHCDIKGVEMLPVTEALKKYDGLKEYWWKILDPEKDAFIREADSNLDNGYFIRARAGEKVDYPLQTCL